MINLCKYCKQEISKEVIPFFRGVKGNYYNRDIFCETFLPTHPDYHKLMSNLEYLEWCAEKRGLFNA